ncbi:MAG: hypothetical protein MUF18_20545, partial [Fimbriiglobus sp.]|nr:hypothetical protein [Fimbriiglobus sp.]
FIVNPTSGLVTEAQLIEVPEPYTMPAGNQLMIAQWPDTTAPGGVRRRVFIVGPNIDQVVLNVSPGDTLYIPSLGTLHQITGLTPATATPPWVSTTAGNAVEISVANPTLIPDLGAAVLTAAPATPQPTYSTPTFGFHRQARPTFGEPSLQLPSTVAIDQTLSQLPSGLDVLFAPNGEVLNTGGNGRIVLWTRNPEAFAGNLREPTGLPLPSPQFQDRRTVYEQAGEMRLIVVYTKTGAVAVQPVELPLDDNPVTLHDPLSTTRDGIGSGL